jgi:hypothetical protein
MAAKIFTACLAGMLLLVTASSAFAESWLTPSEQEFFAALGVNVKVGAKSIDREPRYETLKDIGQRAPEPLKSHILGMAGEFSHLSISPEEKQELLGLAEKTGQMYRDHLRLSLTGVETPEDVASAMAKKGSPFREFSNRYTQWVAREVQARETIAKNLNAITGDLEKRSGTARPAADLQLSIALAGPTISLTGKGGARPVESAILQVTFHKAKADIGPLIDLMASAYLADQGVENVLPNLEKLDPGLAAESAAATAIKTKSFNMPIVKTFGLPRIAPGEEVSIDLDEDLNDVIFFEKLSYKVWTAEGTIAVDAVPGLAAAVAYREQVPRSERFEDLAIDAPGKEPARSPRASANNAEPAKRAFENPLSDRPRKPTGTARAFGQPADKPASGTNPLFGQPLAAQDNSDKPLTREQARQKAQQDSRNEKAALTALASAKQAIGRKNQVLARGYLQQAISLAPDSQAARQAQRLLDGLEK